MSKFDHSFWTAAAPNWILWHYTSNSARESVGPGSDTKTCTLLILEILVDSN